MKKASLLLIFLVGLAFAQGGVRIAQPLDGTITSDAAQQISYVFAAPTTVNPASIVLEVDGTTYSVGDGHLLWSSSVLRFLPTGWTDGQVVECALLYAETWAGDTVAGLPLEHSFTVDLSEPYLVGYDPGEIHNRGRFAIVNDDTYPVTVYLADDFGIINPFSVLVNVDGMVFDFYSPGVSWEEDVMYLDTTAALYPFVGHATTDTFYLGDDMYRYIVTADATTYFGAPGTVIPSGDNFFYIDPMTLDSFYFGPDFPWVTIDTFFFGTDSCWYLYTDATWDTIITDAFIIDPAAGGFSWSRDDTLRVHVYAAEDVPDYGTPNFISIYDMFNVWYFIVDDMGPAASAVYPFNEVKHASNLVYTSCTDLEIIIHVADASGIDIYSFSAMIRGELMDISDPHMRVDTLEMGIMDGEDRVLSANFIYRPNPQYRNGETIVIDFIECLDVFGNPTEFTDFPEPWMLFVDRTGPRVVSTYPPTGITTADQDHIVSFDVVDALGEVDPHGIHFIIENSTGTFHHEYVGYSEVLIPEADWDGRTYTFDPSAAGILYPQGDTIFCTAYSVTDLIDFCEPNRMVHPPVSWHFYVSNGPEPIVLAPLDGEYSACQLQPVSFTFRDPDGINEASVRFLYEGFEFNLASAETTLIPRYFGEVLVRVDTLITPMMNYDGTTGIFTFFPPAMFSAYDAQEINCAITAAEDLLGNPMWGDPLHWNFIVDLTPPYVDYVSPASGSFVGGPEPVITIGFADDVCGKIDILNSGVSINGHYYAPDSYDEIWDPLTNTFLVDPARIGLSFGHHQTMTVCVNRLHDGVENKCSAFSNPALDLPICWTYTIDNMPPAVALVEPVTGSNTACPRQPIKIKITDDLGVNPNSIVMIVQGIMYDISDPELSWIAPDTLVFTPSRDFSAGEDVAFSLATVSDIAGNTLAGFPSPLRSYFRVDRTAPVMVATYPVHEELVITNIDRISMTFNDPSGLDWTTAVVRVTVDGTDVFEYFWGDPALSSAGNTLNLDVIEAGLEFAPGGSVIAVQVTLADRPQYACPDPNTGTFNFTFNITPGWAIDIIVNDVDTIVMGQFIGADAGVDLFDVFAAPPTPGDVPASFQLDPDGERLVVDIKDLEDDSPSWKIWTGTYDVCIKWDRDLLPLTGSFVINGVVDMRDAGVEEFCAPAGTAIWINHNVDFITINTGWNLVSTPVVPNDANPFAVFPMATNVWEFDAVRNVYVEPAEIRVGKGYFVLYVPGEDDPESITYTIFGDPAWDYTVDLPGGWNAIGSVYNFGGVDFTDPADIPDMSVTSPIYSYDPVTRTYIDSDAIYAGIGYWAYVDLPFSWPFATLSVSAWRAASGSVSEFAPVFETGLTLDNQTVRAGRVYANPESARRYQPPAPFGENHRISIVGDVAMTADFTTEETAEWTIFAAKSGTLSYNTTSLPANIALTLDGNDVSGSGKLEITAGKHILKAAIVERPVAFTLSQNSPNPFNGSTTIDFTVPVDCNVRLSVHDMLGRTVSTLMDSDMKAGSHSVVWNGMDDSGVAQNSGVYLYRIEAGSFSSVQKMMYIK